VSLFPRLQGILLRLLMALSFACVVSSSARCEIIYEVSVAHPEQHSFSVRMLIPDVSGEVAVQMPAWNALYQIRDFSSHVRQVSTHAGRQQAPIEKLDKQTWRVQGSGIVEITYTSYWDEPGPFATQLNAEHAFINPAMILMYVPERRSEGVSLTVADFPNDWQASGGSLIDHFHVHGPEGAKTRMFAFSAANYDDLADTPIELAKFQRFDVPGMRPPVSVVVHGEEHIAKSLADPLRRICSYEVKLMDGAPYPNYTFIIHLGNAARGAGGGMERETYPSGNAGAGGLHTRAIHAGTVVRGRRDEHLCLLHFAAHTALE
jgi:predicted metalloprotease with PDZ domain